MVAVSLPTGRIALTPRRIVTIDGQPFHAFSAETQHAVDQPRGTATVRLHHPGLADLRDRWLNRPFEIQLGYDEHGGASRVFSGRVRSIARSFDRGGYRLVVRGIGWSSLLDFPSEEDVVFPANALLYDVIRSLCSRRGLPMFGGERITDLAGTPIRLGGVSEIDDGKVIIPKRTSWLQWIVQKLDLFYYRACDRPDGMFWWGRVAGAPPGTAVLADTFQQGRSLFAATREDAIDGMVTWWDVEGASWTDSDGIPVKIRSFPATVPPDPGGFVTPPGYTREGLSDPALVTQGLADAARNVREISTVAPREWETARYIGKPSLQPGQVVSLTSGLLEVAAGRRWVMSVQHSADDRGIRTTWAGWTGSGTANPPGDDAETITVFTNPRHVGDEYLSHYAVPSPGGTEISFTITVPDTYTAIILQGKGHGCNSYLIDGANSESEVSKIEVWQGGDKPVGTATLPTMPENLEQRLPYGSGTTHWQSFRLPVPGRLTPGLATVKLISGTDRRIPDAYTHDDYEIRDLTITLTGVGSPVLPTGGS